MTTLKKRLSRISGILLVLAAVALCFAPMTAARAEEESEPVGVAVCTARSYLTLRTGPDSSSEAVGRLPAGTFVKVYAQSGKWYQIKYNDALVWGSTAYLSYAPMPAVTYAAFTGQAERTYTIYYQGDSQWKFSSAVRKKACLMTSYAITINNMGIPATPRFIYESNKCRTPVNIANLATNFSVAPVCALAEDSEYLKSFSGLCTYIQSPGKNAVAAIKEAIDRHPEGVICYFKRGGAKHAVVACKYEGDTIYFSDPGRKRATLLTFGDTWVSYGHHMTYSNLSEIIALDTLAEITAAAEQTPAETPTETPTET
ncbi:MAG: SH3 domain-containing protein [Bacillota bacterium]